MRPLLSTASKVKAVYFLSNAAAACVAGYGVLYLQKCGLSGFQIGLTMSVPGLVTILAQPFWGSLADRTLKTGRILFFLCLAGGLLEVLYAFTGTFWVFLALSCLGALFVGPSGALLDSYTFHHLGETDRGFYAHYRVWGAYGFFVMSLGIGFLIAWTDLRVMFLVYAFFSLLMAFLCLRLEEVKLEERQESKPGLGLQGIRQLLAHPVFLGMIACLFLQSLADSSVWGFLSLYLKEIGTPERWIGAAWAVGIPLEVLLFLYAPKMLDRWGAARMVQLGLVCVALRWTLLYFLPFPWAAMTIQLLQGVAFAGVFVGSVTLVDTMVPVTLKATGQSVFASSGFLAGFLGTTTGGWLLDVIGVRNLCLVAGTVATFSLVLFTRFVARPETAVARKTAGRALAEETSSPRTDQPEE